MINKVGVFLQARIGSERLPGKALLKIQDKTIVSHAMTALKKIDADFYALLTDSYSYEKLSRETEKTGFKIFKGSPSDVLDRYISAADFFKVKTIIRATGDNPLVDAEAATLILKSHLKKNADYSAFNEIPIGTGVEILKLEALKTARQKTFDPYDHEHVSPYLYKNPNVFFINRMRAPNQFCFKQGYVTIDTNEDFLYVCKLFSALYSGEPLSISKIIPWLKKNRRS